MKATKSRTRYSRGTIRICSHTIEWRLECVGLSLTSFDEEHITNMLIENYIEGELCTLTKKNREVRGWWNILF